MTNLLVLLAIFEKALEAILSHRQVRTSE